MISVTGLKRSFVDASGEKIAVLNGVDLQVATGEFVAIVGRSGSGKSTLLNILGGLDGSYEGEVSVADTRLSQLGDLALSRFRGDHVGFVFQSFHLINRLTALENVAMPAFFRAANTADVSARARDALGRVGLADKADRLPGQLSGGERQRVALARALFGKPRLLLGDEPTGNLDASTSSDMVSLFREINRTGTTILVVTHEETLKQAAGRVVTMSMGRLT